VSQNILAGKTCIVTGAANGLGAAMAIGLAAHGARLVLADIDEKGLARTANRIESIPGGACAVAQHADMRDEEQVQGIVTRALDEHGSVDVVVNNAGLGPAIVRPDFLSNPLKSWDVPVEKWRRIIEVNAIGPFILSRAAIPHMIKVRRGRIINISTSFGTMLHPSFASYGVSKAALEAMTVAMAKGLEGTGVTANLLLPGAPVDTAQVPDDIGIPRDKLLRPEVMVDACVWLASDASASVSGRRLIAAYWDSSRPDAENLEKASAPAAWPQLIQPFALAETGNLR
jgi:NAD(P)-dependent dehydrogenase (short-subunit alcohol dehydrogenase family)